MSKIGIVYVKSENGRETCSVVSSKSLPRLVSDHVDPELRIYCFFSIFTGINI